MDQHGEEARTLKEKLYSHVLQQAIKDSDTSEPPLLFVIYTFRS